MDIALACNWDPALIPIAKAHGVSEMFGKLQRDVVGGGRVSFILPSVSKRRAAAHIRAIQDAGIAFNYLLNGSCMGGRKLTRSGHRQIEDLLFWLNDLGVNRFTVSIPYLAAKIKRLFPDAHLSVSMFGRVESVEQAKYWEDLGASVVILYENKDFSLFRAIRKHTALKIEVAANLACISRCHMAMHHANMDSHGSNKTGLGLYSLPVCELTCNLLRLEEPHRIVSAQWIRPQDLDIYDDYVDVLKVLDRTSPTRWLAPILEAYATRKYDGNIADLIPVLRQDKLDAYFSLARLPRIIAGYFKPQYYNMLKARTFMKRNRSPTITINAKALDGYLEKFLTQNCRMVSCASCGWCEKYAREAVRIDPAELSQMLPKLQRNLDELESGSFFRYGPTREPRRLTP
jgi:collagenase-like PrtC family protease